MGRRRYENRFYLDELDNLEAICQIRLSPSGNYRIWCGNTLIRTFKNAEEMDNYLRKPRALADDVETQCYKEAYNLMEKWLETPEPEGYIKCIENGLVWPSVDLAAHETGVAKSTIQKDLNGRKKTGNVTSRLYHFTYEIV